MLALRDACRAAEPHRGSECEGHLGGVSVSPSCGAEEAPSKDSDILSECTGPSSGITDNREIAWFVAGFFHILSTPKLTARKAAFFFLALIWDTFSCHLPPTPVHNIFWTPVSVVQQLLCQRGIPIQYLASELGIQPGPWSHMEQLQALLSLPWNARSKGN